MQVGDVQQRIILAKPCEKGATEDLQAVREIHARMEAEKAAHPNLVEFAAHEVWCSRRPESVADPLPTRVWTKEARRRLALRRKRAQLRIGIPRVLSLYAYAPLFSAYLESLGVRTENIVYSDVTTSEMYRSRSSRGSIDPCFPSKIAIAHFHNLLFRQHALKPLDAIFFPMFDVLSTKLVNTRANNGCPTASITPETVEAAYTKEMDLFAQRGILYVHPLVNLTHRSLFARQMFQAWEPLLGVSEEENQRAVAVGFRELERYESGLQRRAREVLESTGGRRPVGNRDAWSSISSRSRASITRSWRSSKSWATRSFAEHVADGPDAGRGFAGPTLRRGGSGGSDCRSA